MANKGKCFRIKVGEGEVFGQLSCIKEQVWTSLGSLDKLGNLGQVWTSLKEYGLVRTSLEKFGQLWTS